MLKIKTKLAAALATLLLGAAGTGTAMAGSAVGSLAVKATTTAACNVNPATLDFGTISGIVTADVAATGTITSTCSGVASVTYGTNATFPAAFSSNGLQFTLYSDAARTKVWDNATNIVTGSGTSFTGSVFGRIAAGQTASAAGAATTNITFTATFN